MEEHHAAAEGGSGRLQKREPAAGSPQRSAKGASSVQRSASSPPRQQPQPQGFSNACRNISCRNYGNSPGQVEICLRHGGDVPVCALILRLGSTSSAAPHPLESLISLLSLGALLPWLCLSPLLSPPQPGHAVISTDGGSWEDSAGRRLRAHTVQSSAREQAEVRVGMPAGVRNSEASGRKRPQPCSPP